MHIYSQNIVRGKVSFLFHSLQGLVDHPLVLSAFGANKIANASKTSATESV